MIPPEYLDLLNYEPRFPREGKMKAPNHPSVSERIGDAQVARNCVQACIIELRERGSLLAAQDLSYSVSLLENHARGEGKRLNTSSLARMAGNIASGFLSHYSVSNVTAVQFDLVAKNSVRLARAIAKELEQ